MRYFCAVFVEFWFFEFVVEDCWIKRLSQNFRKKIRSDECGLNAIIGKEPQSMMESFQAASGSVVVDPAAPGSPSQASGRPGMMAICYGRSMLSVGCHAFSEGNSSI